MTGQWMGSGISTRQDPKNSHNEQRLHINASYADWTRRSQWSRVETKFVTRARRSLLAMARHRRWKYERHVAESIAEPAIGVHKLHDAV